MHEERSPNEKSHAYHYNITFYWPLLQLLFSPNAYLKDGACKFVVSFAIDPVLVIAIKIAQR